MAAQNAVHNGDFKTYFSISDFWSRVPISSENNFKHFVVRTARNGLQPDMTVIARPHSETEHFFRCRYNVVRILLDVSMVGGVELISVTWTEKITDSCEIYQDVWSDSNQCTSVEEVLRIMASGN